MTDLENLLEFLRAVTFAGALLAAALVWRRRRRGRSSTYVMLAFASILLVFIIALLPPEAAWAEATSRLNPLLIMGMPAFLLAFAWSFEGRLPAWVRVVIVASFLVAASLLVVPAGPAGERSALQSALVTIYLAVWTLLAALAATRLWTAAGGSRPIVIRLRLMAVAVLTFNAALFLAVFPTPDAIEVLTTAILPIASAGLFLLAFAPPAALRRMWRSESTELFVHAQRALLAASTPDDVYREVVPLCGRLLGADVAVLVGDDDVCATHGVSEDEARRLARGSVDHRTSSQVYISRVGDRALLVRPSRYAPPLDEEGRQLADGLTLHLALALDRTELIIAHQEARDEAQRAKNDLETTVVGLAHDLRSPTTALAGFAHLMTTTEDPEERAEMGVHLRASADYIERLVAALLEVSRIGRTQTEVEPVDLQDVAHRVAERRRATHQAATIEVGELATVSMNPGRAEQLLDNLVGNALHHGGRDDIEVRLGSQIEDGYIVVRVIDDGVGIPPDQREDVFRLFHRNKTDDRSGSGVGLTLVRRIAESYGGSVLLEDVEVGTSIAVRLPASLTLGPT
jgi:signal transduction histidine kinase